MGLAVQSTLPAGTGYTTLEFKISFVRGMSETSGVIRTEGRVLNAGRRVATAEARITDAKIGCLRMRRRRALCSNFRSGARRADVELEGRQSHSHACARRVTVCLAGDRPIAFRSKTQHLRSGCPCLHEEALADVCQG